MSQKSKLVIIAISAVICLAVTYLYKPASPEVAPASRPVASDQEGPVPEFDGDFARPFEGVPAPKQVEQLDATVEDTEEPWSEQQARRRKRIDELLEERRRLVVDSDEYYRIDALMWEEVQEMGLTEYHFGGSGGVMFPPNATDILNTAYHLDADKRQTYANELAAFEDLRLQREAIDEERRQNAQLSVKDSPELVEKDQRLVAREFRSARDFPEFLKEINTIWQQRLDAQD